MDATANTASTCSNERDGGNVRTRLYCPSCGGGDQLVTLETLYANATTDGVYRNANDDVQPDHTGETEVFYDTSDTTGVACEDCGWGFSDGKFEELVPGAPGDDADAINVNDTDGRNADACGSSEANPNRRLLPERLVTEISKALEGDSNDAEHDALVSVATHFGVEHPDPYDYVDDNEDREFGRNTTMSNHGNTSAPVSAWIYTAELLPQIVSDPDHVAAPDELYNVIIRDDEDEVFCSRVSVGHFDEAKAWAVAALPTDEGGRVAVVAESFSMSAYDPIFLTLALVTRPHANTVTNAVASHEHFTAFATPHGAGERVTTDQAPTSSGSVYVVQDNGGAAYVEVFADAQAFIECYEDWFDSQDTPDESDRLHRLYTAAASEAANDPGEPYALDDGATVAVVRVVTTMDEAQKPTTGAIISDAIISHGVAT
jgi:hypothetical protein